MGIKIDLINQNKIQLEKLLTSFYQKNGVYPACYIGGASFGGSTGKIMNVVSPINGEPFIKINLANDSDISHVVDHSFSAFKNWKSVPAPKRGLLVLEFSQRVSEHKHQLAKIITLESGKPYQESLGEVQEVIDVCQFAVGLSRQLYGLTIATERPDHRMMEQWHPLGVVGIITAFNFPMAVWAWNAMLALVCGNSVIWKPSEQCPLSALSLHEILIDSAKALGFSADLSSVIFADKITSQSLVENPKISLVSATGSCAMGKQVAPLVAKRMGRYLLELGGNNAMIISQYANLALALNAVAFSALGTSGQRCTSLRRLIVHESIIDSVCDKLIDIYNSVAVGDPFDSENLMGPVISRDAIQKMEDALTQSKAQGGISLYSGAPVKNNHLAGFYVRPKLIRIKSNAAILKQETFAPILYVTAYDDLEQAIEIQNDVPQGLSSAIFTQDVCEAELFLSSRGSDCGIANVNIGTSGAEIGGAFGGEKDTGGGRESGSDAWKSYMRRCTNTINYGNDLPLAQGIQFDL